MKTENTPENKAAFQFQYCGQWVLKLEEDVLYPVVGELIDLDGHLLLKPLSQITDEDAAFVAGLIGWWYDFKEYTQQEFDRAYGGGKECPLDKPVVADMLEGAFKGDYVHIDTRIAQHVIDFLRSKGYLLPWRDLSVEEIISYGWAKYENQ